MSRVEQKQATKGSQKWLQILINRDPALVDKALHTTIESLPTAEVEWLSPLDEDQFSEYQDEYFLERLGVTSLRNGPLKNFWPRRGPVWDGLGRIGQDALFLIEAKSHTGEITSPKTGAKSKASRDLINVSLLKTKGFLGSSSTAEWSQTYYQYTNRLAHLYLLREVNKLPAYLVNLHFVNDVEMHGPTSRGEWEVTLKHIKDVLGIQGHKLKPYVIELFFDVVDWRFV